MALLWLALQSMPCKDATMKLFNLSTVAAFGLCATITSANACTYITIKAQDGSVVAGRTMEFGPSLNSNIMTSPRGRVFSNKTPDGLKSMTWKAKYGFVYMNYFGQNSAVDGMNEKGLSASGLYLPGFAKYAEQPTSGLDHAIPYFQFDDWVLSNFQTVEEVKQALQSVTVFSQAISLPGHGNVVFPLHDVLTDATGQSITVEWVDGKTNVYDNKIGILTNSPTFDWQMTNLQNYANLSPYSPHPITLNGITYSGTGQGSGMVGLPGDTTPPSRFVKMAMLTQTALPVNNATQATALAESIIGNVFIDKGLVRGAKDQGTAGIETTQWTVFKDLTNHVLYFKSYDYPQLRSINLDKLNFSDNAKVLSMPISQTAPIAVDVTSSYLSSTSPDNS